MEKKNPIKENSKFYVLFGDKYERDGGMLDFKGSFDSTDLALNFIEEEKKSHTLDEFGYVQIWDVKQEKIVLLEDSLTDETFFKDVKKLS